MSKAKGAYYEHKAIKALEACGYITCRAGGSLGAFDVIAIGPNDIRCVQIKGGDHPYLRPIEREAIAGIRVPTQCTKELWKYPKHARQPIIEIL